MDYHSIHGDDISSFGVPGTHRLATVSASQALDDLKDTAATYISTGLTGLDKALCPSEVTSSSSHGGIKRGQVTEIWGPPGAGRTALGVQLATNALCDGDGVVWVDCFQNVSHLRIATVLEAVRNARGPGDDAVVADDISSRFSHYSCMTLPHLLALISRPTGRAIAANVSLIVVSSLSALLNSALPKSQDGPKANKGLGLNAKRLQALRSIIDSLRKLAATKNCAVVVLSQCATRMQSERGATLVAAVNATVWEQGVSTRIVLLKDWLWQKNKPFSVFLAGVQKLDGKGNLDAADQMSAFKVDTTGISGVLYEAARSSMTASIGTAQGKRKLGRTDFEVPDSEDDEDYGWADEDEAVMPPPPPQWQGSEDILLGQEVGRSEEDTDDGGRSNGEAEASDTEERLS